MAADPHGLRFRDHVEACEEAEAWYGPGAAAAHASAAVEAGDTVRLAAALLVADRTDPGVRLRAAVHAMALRRWEVARGAAAGLDDGRQLHVAIKGALEEIAAARRRPPDLAADIAALTLH